MTDVFTNLDKVTSESAKTAARSIMARLDKLVDFTPDFRFDLHVPNSSTDALAAIIYSTSPDRTAIISIQLNGHFKARFGEHFGSTLRRNITGNGNDEFDIARLTMRVESGRIWAPTP